MNKDIDGRAPIHYAADYGQEDVIRYLVSKGANVNVGLFSTALFCKFCYLSILMISCFITGQR